MHLSGSGPVDGNSQHLSSTRGEIQGQTAALHMANILHQSHNAMHLPVHISGDNKGVQSKCARCNTNRIRDHREANSDLFYEYKAASKGIKKTIQWVKSHQDHGYPWESQQDLLDLKLSTDATLNVMCDHMANKAHQESTTYPDAELLPAEKWALFASTPFSYKITGKLDYGIQQTYHYDNLQEYIGKKHGLSAGNMEYIQTENLRTYLDKQNIHCRANTVKLMHKWIPTRAFLHKQHREDSPICTRCKSVHETADHILVCTDNTAKSERTNILYDALKKLQDYGTPSIILNEIECHLCQTLEVMCFTWLFINLLDQN
jgi:hypothetical protein